MTTITRFESGARMSQAVTYGEMVYLAGQVAGTTVGAGVTAQTQEVLNEIDRLLALAGSDKTRLISATIYLADMATFAEMNAAWDAWVSKEKPAHPRHRGSQARGAGIPRGDRRRRGQAPRLIPTRSRDKRARRCVVSCSPS